MKSAILNDLTKCIGCGACALACKEINKLPKDTSPQVLSSVTRTCVQQQSGLNIRRQCMHCEDPACVSACPVGALRKTDQGPVVYDEYKCIGCRYCMVACPFQVPKYEWDKPLPKVQKCSMCFENCIQKGEQPACTTACPTGASIYGDRDQLIKEARRRIDENPNRYINHIYGVTEAGGTSVIYLSSVPFGQLGFPSNVQDDAYPKLTWKVLSKIPNIVGTGGLLLCGVWWIINRRMKLENGKEKVQDQKEDTFDDDK